jgi:hypothetical protein
MPIKNSRIVYRSVQPDGSTWIHEEHTDHTGEIHEQRYRAAPGADVNALLREHASSWNEALPRRELQAVTRLTENTPIAEPRHADKAEWLKAFVAAFLAARRPLSAAAYLSRVPARELEAAVPPGQLSKVRARIGALNGVNATFSADDQQFGGAV